MSKARCSSITRDQRTKNVVEKLCAGQPQRTIIADLRKEYGLTAHMARIYIHAGRKQIQEDLGEDRAVLIARSLAVYRRIVNGLTSFPRDIIRAQIAADALLGLSVQRLQVETNLTLNTREALGSIDWGALFEVSQSLISAPNPAQSQPTQGQVQPSEIPEIKLPLPDPDQLVAAVDKPASKGPVPASPWVPTNGECGPVPIF